MVQSDSIRIEKNNESQVLFIRNVLTRIHGMNQFKIAALYTMFLLTFSILIVTGVVNAQSSTSTDTASKTNSSSQRNTVSVSASVTIEINNATYKTKETMLKAAVTGFLTSGPNVLKKTPTDQPSVKTKIINKLTNATQAVEGVDATNAILGIEMSRGLKIVNSSSWNQKQPGIIGVDTSSTCKPSGSGLITCDNSVTIR